MRSSQTLIIKTPKKRSLLIKVNDSFARFRTLRSFEGKKGRTGHEIFIDIIYKIVHVLCDALLCFERKRGNSGSWIFQQCQIAQSYTNSEGKCELRKFPSFQYFSSKLQTRNEIAEEKNEIIFEKSLNLLVSF